MFSYSNYIDNTAGNHTTETLSRDDTFLSDTTCKHHLTTCAKLTTKELRGVVCVDNIKVRCNCLAKQYSFLTTNTKMLCKLS